MTWNNRLVRFGAVPALVAGIGLPALLASGCKGKGIDSLTCAADIEARINALVDASASLVAVSDDIKTAVGTACVNIAGDLGATGLPTGAPADFTDDDLTAACDAAVAEIQAEFAAGVSIAVIIEGGGCEVNAQAQFNCEASCDVNGECTPGSIELQCDPGELTGVCEGTCSASATCEGTASVAANCEGQCGGTCNGTCSGACSNGTGANCQGKCDGTCSGTCTGECVLDANASINCGANVDCTGGCSVAYTAPSCTGELTPPACNIDAQCEAGCQGQASFEATCTPPSVSIDITGGAGATLQATLEANLPELWNAFKFQGELALQSAADVVTSFGPAVQAVLSTPACLFLNVGDLAGSVSATASASVSLNVSVSASASVGGTASGG